MVKKNRKRKNRKGWMKIIEAFIAIMLIVSIFLIVASKVQIKEDSSSKITDVEASILREIQLDNNLREETLNINENSLPTQWVGFPQEKIPDYLDCEARICNIGDLCILEGYPNKDVYSEFCNKMHRITMI